jgi:hypothetical protein
MHVATRGQWENHNNLAEENITFIIIQHVMILHRLVIRNIGLCNLQDSNPVLC